MKKKQPDFEESKNGGDRKGVSVRGNSSEDHGRVGIPTLRTPFPGPSLSGQLLSCTINFFTCTGSFLSTHKHPLSNPVSFFSSYWLLLKIFSWVDSLTFLILLPL